VKGGHRSSVDTAHVGSMVILMGLRQLLEQ
jgi:hypothetical protein